MDSPIQPVLRTQTKIFDPRDSATVAAGAELLDATIVRRGEQWWMFLAGQAAGYGPTEIYSASLPLPAPLAPAGWTPTRNPARELAPLADGAVARSGAATAEDTVPPM